MFLCIPVVPSREKMIDGQGKLQFHTFKIVAIYGVQNLCWFKSKSSCFSFCLNTRFPNFFYYKYCNFFLSIFACRYFFNSIHSSVKNGGAVCSHIKIMTIDLRLHLTSILHNSQIAFYDTNFSYKYVRKKY